MKDPVKLKLGLSPVPLGDGLFQLLHAHERDDNRALLLVMEWAEIDAERVTRFARAWVWFDSGECVDLCPLFAAMRAFDFLSEGVVIGFKLPGTNVLRIA